MSKLREAAQQALEALVQWEDEAPHAWSKADENAVAALRAALAEPEQNPFGNDAERYARKLHEEREYYKALFTEHKPEQEPVAWRYRGNLHEFDPSDWAEGPVTPLYTVPTPRKPLTDAEIQTIWAKTFEMGSSANTFARAIELAHGIGEQHE